MTLRKWYWIFLGAALVWVIIGTKVMPYSADPNRPQALQRVHVGLSSIVSGLLWPVRMSATLVQEQISKLASSPAVEQDASVQQLQTELLIAQRRNEELEAAYRANAKLLEDLKQATSISPRIQAKDLVPARVTGLAMDVSADTCTINRGSQSGIRPGMAVLCDMAVVGRVIRADMITSEVALITDSRVKIQATLQRRSPQGNEWLAECVVRGNGKGELRCDSIGTTFTDRSGTKLVVPPARGDRFMIADPSWPMAVQNLEFAVVTESVAGPNLRYAVKAQGSEDLKRQPAVMVLLLDK